MARAQRDRSINRYVLVVEDDAAICALLRQVIADEFRRPVKSALSGQQALDAVLLADQAPSLVVLDLRLPGLDGETVARELYRNGFRPPVLILSAGTRQELSAAARRLQAYATLPKPFDLPDLVAKIRQGLDRGGSQDGLDESPSGRRTRSRWREPAER